MYFISVSVSMHINVKVDVYIFLIYYEGMVGLGLN